MPRSVAVYLVDIVDACDTIDTVLADVDLPTYQQQRATRSAVEREFILIGEAVSSIRRLRPEIADRISNSSMIVGFRNLLAHDYAAVDDETPSPIKLTRTGAGGLTGGRAACSPSARR
jgi:uncharacterized protein with HEPN domain